MEYVNNFDDHHMHTRDCGMRGGTLPQMLRHLVGNPADRDVFFYGCGISNITNENIALSMLEVFRKSGSPEQQTALIELVVFWVRDILLCHDQYSIHPRVLTNIATIVREAALAESVVRPLQLLLIRAEKQLHVNERVNMPTVEPGRHIVQAHSAAQVADAITHLWTVNFPFTHISSFYDSAKKAPLKWYSKLFNHLAAWVPQTILEVSCDKQPATVKFFLSLAKQLRVMGDFQGMFAIVAGLNHGAIQRVSSLWTSLSAKKSLLLKELNLLCSPSHKFQTYRAFASGRKGPIMPYVGLYLADIEHLTEAHERFIDPWANEAYNLQRILEAGLRLKTFFDHMKRLGNRWNANRVDDDTLKLCSAIYHERIHSENVFYYKSFQTQPLRPVFQWNFACWDDATIKMWCITECCITKEETLAQVATAIRKNGSFTSKGLRDAGVESFLDRRAILKAQTKVMARSVKIIAEKHLEQWSTEDLCFLVHMKRRPKSVFDAVYSAGWTGQIVSDFAMLDEELIRVELGITEARERRALATDLEVCRANNGISTEDTKAFVMKWNEFELEEKVAYRKNCFAQNSNFDLLDGALHRRITTARPSTVRGKPLTVARRSNSEGYAHTGRFRSRATRIGSTTSFSFSPPPKQDSLEC